MHCCCLPKRACQLLLCLILLISGPAWTHARVAPPQRIGVILGADLPAYREALGAFRAYFSDDRRWPTPPELFVQNPNPDYYSWANSVRRAQSAGCSVVVIFGDAAAETARREGLKLPLVLAFLDDPPPGNGAGLRRLRETGILSRVPVATLLRTGLQINPFRQLTAIFSESDPETGQLVTELQHASQRLQLELQTLLVGEKLPLAKLRERLRPHVPVYLSESGFRLSELQEIMTAAREQGAPVLSQIHGFADHGALVCLAAEPEEQGRLAAEYAASILAGAEPARLPYREPSRIQLVINLRVAETLGYRVPFQALGSATAVVK